MEVGEAPILGIVKVARCARMDGCHSQSVKGMSGEAEV